MGISNHIVNEFNTFSALINRSPGFHLIGQNLLINVQIMKPVSGASDGSRLLMMVFNE